MCRLDLVVGERHPGQAIAGPVERLILIEDHIAGGVGALADLSLFEDIDGRRAEEGRLIWIVEHLRCLSHLHGLIFCMYSVKACMFVGSGFQVFVLFCRRLRGLDWRILSV